MRPTLTVLSRRDVNNDRKVIIDESRRKVMRAANVPYNQCSLFQPVGAVNFYTFVDQERGRIFMVFEVRKPGGNEYWKVVGGNDAREPEKLPRRPDKHEAFLMSRAGTSPEDDELFANIFSGGPEDYYQ